MVSFVFDWFRNIGGDSSVLRRNAGWCSHYFSQSGLDADCPEKAIARIIDVAGIFQSINVNYNQHGWAYLYDKLDVFPLALEYFLDTCPDHIVVGYELSRSQRKALDAAGKRYVDLRAHPARFLTDYLLSAATNAPDIHDRLVRVAPSRAYLDQHVAFHKARAARRYDKRMNAKEGVVFFAQISVDASRIRNGEILGDDFILHNLAVYLDKHKPKNLYIKQHPHEKMNGALMAKIKGLGGKDTGTHTYDLLSVDQLRLCALSSSVCHEASYFGADAERFYAQPDRTPEVGDVPEVGDYVMMPANIYEGSFWKHILHGEPAPALQYPMPSAPFRAASGLSWG